MLLESNASGIPVVVVKDKMNAACELIHEGVNGFISNFSEEKMAEKILIGIQKNLVMRDDCLDKAKTFDWNQIILKLEKFYENSI